MNRLITLTLAAVVLLCLGFAVPRTAAAQTAKDLVGAWTLLSDVNTSEGVHLTPGQTYTVPPEQPHRVVNAGDSSAVFFVLQGIGKYEFTPSPEAQHSE